VHFPDAAGASIAGYLLGTGRTAVVLAPQRRLDSCSFRAYATALAARNYRVLAFDFAGEGGSTAAPGAAPSGDVAAAVGYLRSQGVTTVVLLGTSRGATASIVAAATVTPPVAGVVSVSGPAVFGGEDARAAAARLTVPSLYLAADSDPGYPDDARSLYDASHGARRLLVVGGSRHGISLLGSADPDSVRAITAIDAFLAAYAPPA
jgi:pimeloyl-ACP methyl ester carboxylesterase